jgi:3-hydroxybutyryl-CoA dehydrogenase
MNETSIIGIAGLGAMGIGIAQVFAQAGFFVIATDLHAPARDAATARIYNQLQLPIDKGRLDESGRDRILARITIAPELSALANAALVIEAIAESVSAKSALLRELEGIISPQTVLATNTSSLSIATLARSLAHPDRLVGLHFFNPAPVMKLVELVSHASASAAALNTAERLAQSAGKTVIRCADTPGFVVNRCARPFYSEALAMLEEGRAPAEIDAAMRAGGYRLGPFALIDLIGADIHLAATEGLTAAMGFHPRYHVFDALKAQVLSGALGRKAGRGFVIGVAPAEPSADADAILLRIEAMLVNEAATLVAEGMVSVDDVDSAMKLGLNFPRGPFESASRHGSARILAELERLAQNAPAQLAGRYAIMDRLADLIR